MGISVEITQNTARSKLYLGAAIAALFLYLTNPGNGINRYRLRGGGAVRLNAVQSNPRQMTTEINQTEADFLMHCIDVWCNETPLIAGRPVMFTSGEGGEERVLLTHDQISDLFLKLQCVMHHNNA